MDVQTEVCSYKCLVAALLKNNYLFCVVINSTSSNDKSEKELNEVVEVFGVVVDGIDGVEVWLNLG